MTLGLSRYIPTFVCLITVAMSSNKRAANTETGIEHHRPQAVTQFSPSGRRDYRQTNKLN